MLLLLLLLLAMLKTRTRNSESPKKFALAGRIETFQSFWPFLEAGCFIALAVRVRVVLQHYIPPVP
jgi:hypothetical protein